MKVSLRRTILLAVAAALAAVGTASGTSGFGGTSHAEAASPAKISRPSSNLGRSYRCAPGASLLPSGARWRMESNVYCGRPRSTVGRAARA